MTILIFFGICTFLAAKSILLAKILWSQNCSGISGKTQVLYAIIFAARYLDIVMTYYRCTLSIFLLKIAFIVLTNCSVLSIYFLYNHTYQKEYDNFRIERLILPCIVLSLLANYSFKIDEVFWTFSIYLESVAIIPQMYFISQFKQIESIVFYYISALSMYKIFYLMDIVYRFYMNEYYDKISLAGCVVQIIFYCDFFANYVPMTNDTEIDEESGFSEEDKVDDKFKKIENVIVHVIDEKV
ncbi:PREDICTED: ER lumen protein-retaining receptor-like [Ceratosolen solmsi marchali]|uniref:ER lumen protein-retaining receptor-like n=1 Tax=Ceratosolen solmsi marchali TaxID=326594 RepID=A0AAJ7DUG2_9HYME|nr:PREDICTED: ER lumen protein-retaining receptor-like [Ceratosolen solmsi marchali]